MEPSTDGLSMTSKQAMDSLAAINQRLLSIGQALREVTQTLSDIAVVINWHDEELVRLYTTYENRDSMGVRYGDN